MLLQTMLARNPGIFREKSTELLACLARYSMKTCNYNDELHLIIYSCFHSEQMLCSSQWYHRIRSPKIPCIAQPSLQTFSRLQFLPTHQGEPSCKAEPFFMCHQTYYDVTAFGLYLVHPVLLQYLTLLNLLQAVYEVLEDNLFILLLISDAQLVWADILSFCDNRIFNLVIN